MVNDLNLALSTIQNPFDTSDDVNPFGSDPASGLEHYDPFGGDGKAPPRPASPPASAPGDLIFHGT